jgi:uncharacterized protein YndB with AHSA1/START domain
MTNQPTDLQAFVRLQRLYAAPRERVFRAWTEPQALERWFKPFGMPISVVHLDLRLGGRFHFNVYEPSGKTSSISGQYVEILSPEKLVYTWISDATDSCETLVTMLFTERNTMTELTLIHERFARPEQIQPHLDGWTSMFNALDTIFPN